MFIYNRMKNKLSTDVTSLQQKLVDLESSTTNKIRSVVLEVLSSVTHSSPDTRFFGDWLRANFLTREQFDVRFNVEWVAGGVGRICRISKLIFLLS